MELEHCGSSLGMKTRIAIALITAALGICTCLMAANPTLSGNNVFTGSNTFAGLFETRGNCLTNSNHKIAFTGDSLTSIGWYTNLLNFQEFSTWPWTNVSASSQTTTQVFGQVVSITNFIAKRSTNEKSYCWVWAGYNDDMTGVLVEGAKSNLMASWSSITNVGAIPVVATLYWKVSENSIASYYAVINSWIRSNYTAWGAILVDAQKVVSPTNGMTSDGLHLNDAGKALLAKSVAAAINLDCEPFTLTTVGTNQVYFGSEGSRQFVIGQSGTTNILMSQEAGATTLINVNPYLTLMNFGSLYAGLNRAGFQGIQFFFAANVMYMQLTNAVSDIFLGGPSNVKLLGNTYLRTRSFTVTAPTNGVAPYVPATDVDNPVGSFGSMMLNGVTNTVSVASAGVYYQLTNYVTLRTNNFGANKFTGYLTNVLAGFYRVGYYVVCLSGASDTLEAEVFVNDVGKEEISGFHTFDNPARVDDISGSGTLYLPANSAVSLRLNNRTDDDDVTVWRASLTIGTP